MRYPCLAFKRLTHAVYGHEIPPLGSDICDPRPSQACQRSGVDVLACRLYGSRDRDEIERGTTTGARLWKGGGWGCVRQKRFCVIIHMGRSPLTCVMGCVRACGVASQISLRLGRASFSFG